MILTAPALLLEPWSGCPRRKASWPREWWRLWRRRKRTTVNDPGHIRTSQPSHEEACNWRNERVNEKRNELLVSFLMTRLTCLKSAFFLALLWMFLLAYFTCIYVWREKNFFSIEMLQIKMIDSNHIHIHFKTIPCRKTSYKSDSNTVPNNINNRKKEKEEWKKYNSHK